MSENKMKIGANESFTFPPGCNLEYGPKEKVAKLGFEELTVKVGSVCVCAHAGLPPAPRPPSPAQAPTGPACLGRRRSRENVSGTRRTVSCSLFFFYNAQGCPRLSAAASGSVLEVKSRKGRFGNGRQGEGRSHSLPAPDRGAVAVSSSFPANRLPEAAWKAVPGTPGPGRWPASPGWSPARPSLPRSLAPGAHVEGRDRADACARCHRPARRPGHRPRPAEARSAREAHVWAPFRAARLCPELNQVGRGVLCGSAAKKRGHRAEAAATPII